MNDNAIPVVRLREIVTLHQNVGGYTDGYSLSGENDIYVYNLPQSIFFCVSHDPFIDKWIGTERLAYSFTHKQGNANYTALMLNSRILQKIIQNKMKERRQMSVDSLLSYIILPCNPKDVQDAIGFVEIVRQFFLKNEADNLFSIEYPSLKAGLFRELADAISCELLWTGGPNYLHLTFIQPWVEIYKSLPILEYTKGANLMISDVALLQCMEKAFDKLTEPRSELYANLMRFRIFRAQQD